MQRRLTAILCADMVGYSRLMEADEIGTIERQRAHRRDLINPGIEQYHGRIVKEMGDGILVEFPSVVEAVQCAVQIQRAMPAREADLHAAHRIHYRVGINLGDVLVEDGDIFGDGVNVAARMQAMAEPDGICISGTAYDQMRSTVAVGYQSLGDVHVKNIERPIRAYKVLIDEGQVGAVVEEKRARPHIPRRLPTVLAILLLAAVAGGGWWWLPRPDLVAADATQVAEGPSIAVLPFDNLSGDPDQEYLSDGITNEIITALSRQRWLSVIARNSTFAYKGQPMDVKRIGRELGVRYVLEGSLSKSGQRVRVAAQLIEAETGKHVWAERYERELKDVFTLQDEMTEAISAHLGVELLTSEIQTARAKPAGDLASWDLYWRGLWHFLRLTKDDIAQARTLFGKAAEQSPEFARAFAGLAHVAHIETTYGYSQDPRATLEQGLRDARRAVALDGRDAGSHSALGYICMLLGDHECAIRAFEKSVDLNPGAATYLAGLGTVLNWSGRSEEAIPLLTRAIELSPRDPFLWTYYHARSGAHSQLGQFELAISDAKAAIDAKGDVFWPYLALALAYNSSGRDAEARAAYDRADALKPELSATFLRRALPGVPAASLEKWLDGLRRSGLPEI